MPSIMNQNKIWFRKINLMKTIRSCADKDVLTKAAEELLESLRIDPGELTNCFESEHEPTLIQKLIQCGVSQSIIEEYVELALSWVAKTKSDSRFRHYFLWVPLYVTKRIDFQQRILQFWQQSRYLTLYHVIFSAIAAVHPDLQQGLFDRLDEKKILVMVSKDKDHSLLNWSLSLVANKKVKQEIRDKMQSLIESCLLDYDFEFIASKWPLYRLIVKKLHEEKNNLCDSILMKFLSKVIQSEFEKVKKEAIETIHYLSTIGRPHPNECTVDFKEGETNIQPEKSSEEIQESVETCAGCWYWKLFSTTPGEIFACEKNFGSGIWKRPIPKECTWDISKQTIELRLSQDIDVD